MSGGALSDLDRLSSFDEPAFGFGINAVAGAQSRALFEAAENLLAKAERAVGVDDERAQILVRRALDLGFDEHEQMVPGLQIAGYRLFSVVADAAGDFPVGDERWLDVAERYVDETRGPLGVTLVETLAELCDDGELHELEPSEIRRLRDIVLRARRRDGRGDVETLPVEDTVPAEERETVVLGLVRLAHAYRTEVAPLLAGMPDLSRSW